MDHMRDVVIEAKLPLREGNIADIVPIRDEDVVLGEHGANGRAQERGEMPRQRRDQEYRRLRLLGVLLEMQQRAEWGDFRKLLLHLQVTVADLDLADPERRPHVAQAGEI